MSGESDRGRQSSETRATKQTHAAIEAGLVRIRARVEDEAPQIYRSMPWRYHHDPYVILISEVMLQQTQVSRVREKYPLFLDRFPTVRALAKATPAAVITAWQGLGYNRRALALQRAAAIVHAKYNGALAQSREELIALPAIGEATAGAILTYAYNRRALFIETNIRRLFIFHCFHDRVHVADSEIMPLLERLLPSETEQCDYRRWYYALTDLGALVIKNVGYNPNVRSRAYRPQAPFKGSQRALRGAILRALSQGDQLQVAELSGRYSYPDAAVNNAVTALRNEGFIVQEGENIYLKGSRE